MTIAINPHRHGFERLLTVFIAIALLIGFAILLVPAARADTFTITLQAQVVRGAPGSEHLLFDGPMPVSGELCSLTASDAGNNRSVHPDNDLRLESNGQVVNFFDVERAPDVSTPGDQSIVPGATGTVTLTLGGDGVFSAELLLVFECEAVATTTTTPVLETKTTTIPDEVSPTSIVSTTTTIVGATTTIVSTTAEVSPDTLPFTGSENGTTGLLALVLVASGALALVGTLVFQRETDE
jgi:hypothetical protein